jgi:hypothetical protein
MRHFDFPDDVLEEIQRDRFQHPTRLVQERMEILWLKAHGISHAQIAELSCAARSTVQRTLDLYVHAADWRRCGVFPAGFPPVPWWPIAQHWPPNLRPGHHKLWAKHVNA